MRHWWWWRRWSGEVKRNKHHTDCTLDEKQIKHVGRVDFFVVVVVVCVSETIKYFGWWLLKSISNLEMCGFFSIENHRQNCMRHKSFDEPCVCLIYQCEQCHKKKTKVFILVKCVNRARCASVVLFKLFTPFDIIPIFNGFSRNIFLSLYIFGEFCAIIQWIILSNIFKFSIFLRFCIWKKANAI